MSERDIVGRLRDPGSVGVHWAKFMREAADCIDVDAAEITRLRAEVTRMREALEEIERGPSVDAVCNGWWESSCIEMSELARAALDNSP